MSCVESLIEAPRVFSVMHDGRRLWSHGASPGDGCCPCDCYGGVGDCRPALPTRRSHSQHHHHRHHYHHYPLLPPSRRTHARPASPRLSSSLARSGRQRTPLIRHHSHCRWRRAWKTPWSGLEALLRCCHGAPQTMSRPLASAALWSCSCRRGRWPVGTAPVGSWGC